MGYGCSIAAINPYPAVFNGEMKPYMNMDKFVKDPKAAEKKLIKYWREIGFRSIDDEFMIFDLSKKPPLLELSKEKD